MLIDTRKSKLGKVYPLPWNAVSWSDQSLWGQTFQRCANSTVPHIQSLFENESISHVVQNFKIAAQQEEGSFGGTDFGDGDFYKWMESAMYVGAKLDRPDVFVQLDGYIELIGSAQLEDGYISTKQIIGERLGTAARLSDVNEFEVYNFGHLFTAACLYKRLTGKDNFLAVAIKAAHYLERLYHEAAKSGEGQTAVCPSHYMGLIELYRTTENPRFLALAQLAIHLRDTVKDGTDDNQDRIKLKDHDKILGHAVRANYLYAGVADLYAETGDAEYKSMLDKVWNHLMTQKIYITGGCGALYNGVSPYGNFWTDQKTHQSYGYEYQLPNITAYNETCASLGHVFWAYRMFAAQPEAKYFDAIEKSLLNTNLASISLSGDRFFYENMLRRTKSLPYELIWPLSRSEYLSSFCCPPNIARVLSQTSEYAYLVSKNQIWTGLYGENIAVFSLENGSKFTLHQKTNYPWDGTITFSGDNVEVDNGVELKLRIPAWAVSGTVSVNGVVTPLTESHSESYYTIVLEQLKGCQITLTLDMPVRLTTANPLVEETINQGAVERGPIVYCIEGMDVPLSSLDGLLLKQNSVFSTEDFSVGGQTLKALVGEMNYNPNHSSLRDTLYSTLLPTVLESIKVRMIPYFAWDNRGFDEMKIWLPIAY